MIEQLIDIKGLSMRYRSAMRWSNAIHIDLFSQNVVDIDSGEKCNTLKRVSVSRSRANLRDIVYA